MVQQQKKALLRPFGYIQRSVENDHKGLMHRLAYPMNSSGHHNGAETEYDGDRAYREIRCTP